MKTSSCKIIDEVVARLDRFNGKVSYPQQIIQYDKKHTEIMFMVESTTNRNGEALFAIAIPKKHDFPVEFFACSEMIKSGYRRCDDDRALKSCLLSMFRRDFVKMAVGRVAEIETPTSLFGPKNEKD
jgi:hypothetical protein